MAGVAAVTILSVITQAFPPSTHIEFEVRNEATVPIWLVDDRWLIWHQTDREVELCYARGRMQPGAQVFGYFPPSVVRIERGGSISREIHLTWPQPLDRLWNAERSTTPSPGEYRVSVRIGYGMSPKPNPSEVGESVEAPIFRWQKEAISQPAPMEVPFYKLTPTEE